MLPNKKKDRKFFFFNFLLHRMHKTVTKLPVQAVIINIHRYGFISNRSQGFVLQFQRFSGAINSHQTPFREVKKRKSTSSITFQAKNTHKNINRLKEIQNSIIYSIVKLVNFSHIPGLVDWKQYYENKRYFSSLLGFY